MEPFAPVVRGYTGWVPPPPLGTGYARRQESHFTTPYRPLRLFYGFTARSVAIGGRG